MTKPKTPKVTAIDGALGSEFVSWLNYLVNGRREDNVVLGDEEAHMGPGHRGIYAHRPGRPDCLFFTGNWIPRRRGNEYIHLRLAEEELLPAYREFMKARESSLRPYREFLEYREGGAEVLAIDEKLKSEFVEYLNYMEYADRPLLDDDGEPVRLGATHYQKGAPGFIMVFPGCLGHDVSEEEFLPVYRQFINSRKHDLPHYRKFLEYRRLWEEDEEDED